MTCDTVLVLTKMGHTLNEDASDTIAILNAISKAKNIDAKSITLDLTSTRSMFQVEYKTNYCTALNLMSALDTSRL